MMSRHEHDTPRENGTSSAAIRCVIVSDLSADVAQERVTGGNYLDGALPVTCHDAIQWTRSDPVDICLTEVQVPPPTPILKWVACSPRIEARSGEWPPWNLSQSPRHASNLSTLPGPADRPTGRTTRNGESRSRR